MTPLNYDNDSHMFTFSFIYILYRVSNSRGRNDLMIIKKQGIRMLAIHCPELLMYLLASGKHS